MPPNFEEPPDVEPIAEFYWQAFSELSSSRSVGMGVGPIPFHAYIEFARVYGIDDVDQFEALRGVVRAIDDEYLRLNKPKSEE